MTGRLADIDALVIETSTIATVKGGAEVEGVVRFLGEHGFVVADIVGLPPPAARQRHGAARSAVRAQEAAPRHDRRWAASA